MAVVHRRTFYARVGQADAVVSHLRDGDKMFIKYGLKPGRIMTDHISGRTDRVVWEVESASLGAMEKEMEQVMKKPGAAKAFGVWFGKLSELITHAEVDNFSVR